MWCGEPPHCLGLSVANTADFRAFHLPRQINNVPKNVRDRLPAEYHRALQVRDHVRPGQLQATVQRLVIAFHDDFDLVFPPLNYVPILVRHIRDLLLPGTYIYAVANPRNIVLLHDGSAQLPLLFCP